MDATFPTPKVSKLKGKVLTGHRMKKLVMHHRLVFKWLLMAISAENSICFRCQFREWLLS